jgi:hypothetical protein
MRTTLPVISLLLAGATAQADPLPVHTATRGIGHTNLGVDERVELADAMAQVFESSFPEGNVLSADETRTRVNLLDQNALACDQPRCAPTITNPLHGIGLVLVQQSRTHGRVHIEVSAINLRGEVVARDLRDEAISNWNEAVTLAHVMAQSFVPQLQRVFPSLAPDAGPPPAPADAAVAPADVPATPVDAAVAVTPEDAGVRVVTYHRRPLEAVGGGALILGGLALTILGVVYISIDGDTRTSPADMTMIETFDTAGQAAGFLVGGVVALGAGTFLLWDGLRLHADVDEQSANPRPRRASVWDSLHFGIAPFRAGGAALNVGGRF